MITLLPKNLKFAVLGDIHGLNDELVKLIEKIKATHGPIPLFATGDFIDRGAKSFEVLDTAIANRIQGCRGNHDDWMIHYIENDLLDEWSLSDNMGGKPTVASYERNVSHEGYKYPMFKSLIPLEHAEFMTNLPYWRIVRIEDCDQEFVLSHAGITPSLARLYTDSKDTQTILTTITGKPNGREAIMWGRPGVNSGGTHKFRNGYQIMGHTPVKEPVLHDHSAFVDTGAFYSSFGHLSAIILPEKTIISVSTKKENFYI